MSNKRAKAAKARRASQSRRTVGQNNTQGPKLPKSQQSYTERRADFKQTRSEQTTSRGATKGNSNVTTSSSRSARGRAGAKAADKKTTSSGRGAGKAPTVDSRAQRQKVSNAKVTSSGGKGSGTAKVTASGGGSARTPGGPSTATANRWRQLNQSAKTSGKGPVKGAPGTSGAPTNAQPTSRTAKGQTTANKMKRGLAGAKSARAAAGKAAAARAVGKGAAHVGAAAAGLNAGPVADGTMKGKPTGAKQGPPAPKAKDFGSAFKAARAAGQKEFTWKGKRYHTRRADGK